MRHESPTFTPRLIQAAGLFLAAWLAFSFSFTPLRESTDEWWHLKTGRYVAEHGLPQKDIFTYTAEDYDWFNHEWLTQVAMWGVYRAGQEAGFGGVRAVIAFKTLFILLAYVGFGGLLARRMREPMWAWVAAAIGLALARRTFYPRPPFVSYFLIALVFWMLIEWRSGRLRARWLCLLVPMFALWANLHGGWAAGIIFVAAFWADAAWDLGVDWSLGMDTRPSKRRIGFLTGLGIACGVATLANPYGWRLYDMFNNVMNDPLLKYLITELRPPDWIFVIVLEAVILVIVAAAIRPVRWFGWLVTALALVGLHFTMILFLHHNLDETWQPNAWVVTAIAVAGWAVLMLRVRPVGWPAHLLLGAFFLQQGIHHVRHLPLTAIATMPGLAWGLEAWSGALASRMRPSFAARRYWIPAATVLLLVYMWSFRILPNRTEPRSYEESYWGRNLMLLAGWGTEPNAYPRKAMDLIIQADLPRKLFNDGNNSGYYMWRLAPDLLTDQGRAIPGREGYRLFTDNRYDIYGSDFLAEEHSVLMGLTAEEAEDANKHIHPKHPYAAWQTIIKKYGIETMVLPSVTRVNRVLDKSGWVRVYMGEEVSVWVRNTPQNQAAIERAKQLTGER